MYILLFTYNSNTNFSSFSAERLSNNFFLYFKLLCIEKVLKIRMPVNLKYVLKFLQGGFFLASDQPFISNKCHISIGNTERFSLKKNSKTLGGELKTAADELVLAKSLVNYIS